MSDQQTVASSSLLECNGESDLDPKKWIRVSASSPQNAPFDLCNTCKQLIFKFSKLLFDFGTHSVSSGDHSKFDLELRLAPVSCDICAFFAQVVQSPPEYPPVDLSGRVIYCTVSKAATFGFEADSVIYQAIAVASKHQRGKK